MQIINVIGGSGFIGTCLVRRLRSHKHLMVQITDKASSEAHPDIVTLGDVRSIEQLRISIADESVIINLAAEHRDDVSPLSLYKEVNVGGAENICTVAREKRVNKIIFTSSVAVYGFAPIGTAESGEIQPFNEYGLTKWEAEKIYKAWQAEDPQKRTLVIVRPTVVFGERNRGNVFNLLKQISSGRFVMIGDGQNRKSIAYVENVAAFLDYSLNFKPGIHIYNYIDKPDLSMYQLVSHVNKLLGRNPEIKLRLPIRIGFLIGKSLDLVARLTGKKFSISTIRIKKFCANSIYESAVDSTEFIPPVGLMDAIEKTVKYEFIENHKNEQVFYTE